MKNAFLLALMLGGCGGEPLAIDHWTMSWSGHCDGEMTDGFYRCGTLAGSYSIGEGVIDFGVAKAVVTTRAGKMTGVVATADWESCFSANHD